MIVLDTDILTLAMGAHARVLQRIQAAPEIPVTSIVSRIEVLRGRFEFVLKAANADQLLKAQKWLEVSERDLAQYSIVPFNAVAAAESDRLRKDKKLRKIGRKDLLIAAIALANHATLVTRNFRDFRQVPGLRLENWAD
jgi:tRNA(fMet)-specific endonuclease VapC